MAVLVGKLEKFKQHECWVAKLAIQEAGETGSLGFSFYHFFLPKTHDEVQIARHFMSVLVYGNIYSK